ncbi:hypothetical protein F7U66_00645 [Vibrio parahaemolyticus]|nr:hypothetical protein [Vibrio parahaemolyticus]
MIFKYFAPAVLPLVASICVWSYFNLPEVYLFYLITVLTLFVAPIPLFLVFRGLEDKVYGLEERNNEVIKRLRETPRELNFDNCRTGEEQMLLKKLAFVSQVSARRYKLLIYDRSEPMLGVKDVGQGDVEVMVTSGSLAMQSHEYLVVDAALADLVLVEHERCLRNRVGFMGSVVSTLFLLIKIKSILSVCSIERSFELDDVDYLLQFE